MFGPGVRTMPSATAAKARRLLNSGIVIPDPEDAQTRGAMHSRSPMVSHLKRQSREVDYS
ncbi:hypothetical protein MRA01_63440 [Methylobacterium radiotolerans]|nr:hypothetical protein MRA01_63440 [Methylobacterium radiotolerans]